MTTTLRRSWCSCGARILNLSRTTSPAQPLRRLYSPPPPDFPSWFFVLRRGISSSSYKLAADSGSNGVGLGGLGKGEAISMSEAKRLLRLVNVDSLKESLGMEGKEVIEYSELLRACESTGIARSRDEAVAFSRVLDDAGVILLFRDKVYLNPNKVVDLVRRAVPLSLMPEDDPVIAEFNKLQEKKEEIDVMAHKQVRRILWTGLGFAVAQVGLFFRLTFWEFSWDVMEPIAFFTSATGIVVCYAYFLITSRDPTYQDLMKRLFLSRQRALLKKHSIDLNRLKELQMRCSAPVDAATSIKNRVGVDVKLDDALHKD